MVNAISSTSASYASAATQAVAATQTQANAASTTPAASPQADSVELSPVATAVAMHQQGMQVSTIAANMGITTKAVDSYLGITSSGSGGGGGGTSELQSVAARTKVLGPSKT